MLLIFCFVFCSGRCVYAAAQQSQANPPQSIHTIPSIHDDWTTLWSKEFGSSFPTYGDSLGGVYINRSYTAHELFEAPFVEYILMQNIVTREELNSLFNAKSSGAVDDGQRRLHGI